MIKYKLKTYICRICGKQFKARFSHNLTCSQRCKSRARKIDNYPMTGFRKCDNCGKEYYYIHGMPNWNKDGAYNKRGSFESSKYCSYECGKEVSRNKSKQTKYDKYGDPNYNNIEQVKETNVEKYGYPCCLSSPEIRNKVKETCLKNNGVEYPLQNKKIHDKTVKTSLKYHKTENKVYELILKKFPNTIREYSSELYPWNCDFYIPELDLYIEFQGHTAHGLCPYDSENDFCKKQLEKWKDYNYTRYIDVWTVRDPLKRKVAKDNNLNFIEFWNIKDVIEWLNSI